MHTCYQTLAQLDAAVSLVLSLVRRNMLSCNDATPTRLLKSLQSFTATFILLSMCQSQELQFAVWKPFAHFWMCIQGFSPKQSFVRTWHTTDSVIGDICYAPNKLKMRLVGCFVTQTVDTFVNCDQHVWIYTPPPPCSSKHSILLQPNQCGIPCPPFFDILHISVGALTSKYLIKQSSSGLCWANIPQAQRKLLSSSLGLTTCNPRSSSQVFVIINTPTATGVLISFAGTSDGTSTQQYVSLDQTGLIVSYRGPSDPFGLEYIGEWHQKSWSHQLLKPIWLLGIANQSCHSNRLLCAQSNIYCVYTIYAAILYGLGSGHLLSSFQMGRPFSLIVQA